MSFMMMMMMRAHSEQIILHDKFYLEKAEGRYKICRNLGKKIWKKKGNKYK